MAPEVPSWLLSESGSLPLLKRLEAKALQGNERAEALAWVARQTENLEQAVKPGSKQAKAAAKLFVGGLWYAVDDLDSAHEIFQEDSSVEGSYWHGMLHRREGDYFNARYWFRRAGRIEALRDSPLFDADDFAKRCEAAQGNVRDSVLKELLDTQRREWEWLMASAFMRSSSL
jgi:hypothetical protein